MGDTPDLPETAETRPAAPFDLRSAIQDSLPDVDADVVVLHLTLLHLGKLVETPANRLLAPDGLELSDRSVLVALLFAGPPHRMSPTQLATAILQTTSGMSKTLRRLQALGLVDREPDPADGRGRLVRLTTRGKDEAGLELRALASDWENRFGHLDADERAQMSDAAWSLLQRLDPNFDPGPGRRIH